MADKVVPKRKLVEITDAVVVAMAGNAEFLKEFPFLQSLADKKAKGCGSCGRKKAEKTAFDAAKSTIAGLDDGKKRRMKELLNAQQLRVSYYDAKGNLKVLTIS